MKHLLPQITASFKLEVAARCESKQYRLPFYEIIIDIIESHFLLHNELMRSTNVNIFWGQEEYKGNVWPVSNLNGCKA